MFRHGTHDDDIAEVQAMNRTQLTQGDVAVLERYRINAWFTGLSVASFRQLVIDKINEDRQRSIDTTGIPENDDL
jgi:hypothetical protein